MALRVGIVGRRGATFAAGIRTTGDALLEAMCDLNGAQLNRDADSLGIAHRFTSFEQMLDHVDAVVVAAPMQLHASQAIEALDAGKHVLSEVTACVSIEECWELVAAQRRSQATYMLSENYCYMRDNVLVREMAKRGLFGDLYYGEGEYIHDVKSLHHNPDGTPTWRSQWQVGQRGNTYPTHSLGPVMQWFGELDPSDRIDSVVCLGSGIHSDPEHPHDDTTITLAQLQSGKLIRLRLDMMSNRPPQAAYYAVQGTSGVYEASRLETERGHVWIGENPGQGYVADIHRTWRPLSDFDDLLPSWYVQGSAEAAASGHGGADYFVARDFVDTVLGRRENPVDVYDAVEWTAVGLCSQESIEAGGKCVKIPRFREAPAPQAVRS